jgi:aryl-alcohol dehydrogenase-like predicted oxidoreductase
MNEAEPMWMSECRLERRTLGRTGLLLAPLGWGTAPAGFLKSDLRTVDAMIGLMRDSGLELIDTAAAYDDAEVMLGAALTGRRDDFVLVGKCGMAVAGLAGAEWSASLIDDTLERSLRRLRTDHLDVLLLHSCGLEFLMRDETIAAMIRARDSGKARFIGYSGDNEAALHAACDPRFDVVEISVNLCDQMNIGMVLPAAECHGTGVLAKRMLANAAWRPAEEQRGIYRHYAEPYRHRLAAMGLDEVRTRLGMPWDEFALRFTLSFPGVHVGIVGTTRPGNLTRNLAFCDRGPLPVDDVEEIRSRFREASEGDCWLGLT